MIRLISRSFGFALLSFCFSGFSLAQETLETQCLRSFNIRINTQTEFDFGDKSRTHHNLSGQLTLVPVTHSTMPSHLTWWALQMTDVKQVGNGVTMPFDPTYELPFAVGLNAQALIDRFYFPVELPQQEQDKLKGLAYYFQFANFSQVQSITPDPFARIENDTVGLSSARYVIEVSEQGVETIVKEKYEYSANSGVSGRGGDSNTVQRIEILSSQHRMVPDECWFTSVKGEESLHFSGLGDAFSLKTDQSYSILRSSSLAESLLIQLPGDLSSWQIEQEATELSEEELIALAAEFRTQLMTYPLTDLRASELALWLEKFDPVIDTLGTLLIEKAFDDETNMRLFNALGHLDSDNGNQLLVNLMQTNTLTETERFRAMRAITTGTRALTPQLTEQLLVMLNDQPFEGSESLWGSAIMAMGAVLERRQNNELTQDILSALQDKVGVASDVNEKAALIAALGNASHEDSLNIIINHQSDETPRVRANVATALGQIGTPRAHQALSGMLYTETDNRAQQAVFGAIGQFELEQSDIETITQLASESDSERTRASAIKAIATQTHKKKSLVHR